MPAILLELKDLQAVVAACSRLDLEFVSGRDRFLHGSMQAVDVPDWVGSTERAATGKVGPLACDHLIRPVLAGGRRRPARPREIGLFARPDGGWLAAADIESGCGLELWVGIEGMDFLYAYRVEALPAFARAFNLRIADRYVGRDNSFNCQLEDTIMAGDRRVKVRAYRDGKLEIDVNGCQGPACEVLTKGFVDFMGGTTTNVQAKAEMEAVNELTIPVEQPE